MAGRPARQDAVGEARRPVAVGGGRVIPLAPADGGVLVADGPDTEAPGKAHEVPLPGVVFPGPGDGARARRAEPGLLAYLLPANHGGLPGAAFQGGGAAHQPTVFAAQVPARRPPAGADEAEGGEWPAPGVQAEGAPATGQGAGAGGRAIDVEETHQLGHFLHQVAEISIGSIGVAGWVAVDEKHRGRLRKSTAPGALA